MLARRPATRRAVPAPRAVQGRAQRRLLRPSRGNGAAGGALARRGGGGGGCGGGGCGGGGGGRPGPAQQRRHQPRRPEPTCNVHVPPQRPRAGRPARPHIRKVDVGPRGRARHAPLEAQARRRVLHAPVRGAPPVPRHHRSVAVGIGRRPRSALPCGRACGGPCGAGGPAAPDQGAGSRMRIGRVPDRGGRRPARGARRDQGPARRASRPGGGRARRARCIRP